MAFSASEIWGPTCLLFLFIYVLRILVLAFQADLRRIPGPTLSRFTSLPLKLQVLSGNRTHYIHHLHKIHGGPTVRIAPNEVAVADMESCRQIHKIGTQFIKSAWYQDQVPTQYDDETCGVFGIRDPRKAAARRKLYQQAGTRAAVHSWEPRIVEIVYQAMDKIGRDLKLYGKADVFKWFPMMTTDLISELAFGEPFRMVEKEEKPQLIKDIEGAMMAVGTRSELRPLWEIFYRLPIPVMHHLVMGPFRIRDWGMIAVRNTKAAPRGSGKTIFSKMYPEDGSQLFADELMADEAANLIIAGSDTTGVAMTYVVYCVLSTPGVKQKLLDELALLPEEGATWEQLENSQYLNNVIQETLRLYPSVPGSLPRVCSDADTILGGYKIPAGTTVVTQALTIQRDPIVFPEPNQFKPERWANSTKEMREHFMAFGGSARVCLGQNLARLELLHGISKFFKCFPNAGLANTATPKSMKTLDVFGHKPVGGKFEVTLG